MQGSQYPTPVPAIHPEEFSCSSKIEQLQMGILFFNTFIFCHAKTQTTHVSFITTLHRKFGLPSCQFFLSSTLFCAYFEGKLLEKIDYNSLCIWSTASESKRVYSRYSLLSQAGKIAELIRIKLAILNWFRRCTSLELNSLNSIRLMRIMASEPGLTAFEEFWFPAEHKQITIFLSFM